MNRIRTFATAAAIIVGSMAGGWLAQHVESASAAGAIGPLPAGYVPLNPGRIFDSRGWDAASPNPLLPGGSRITINTGEPGVTAVAVNITVTDTTAAGFVSAWAQGDWPGTSVLNSSGPNQTVANFVFVPVAPDGSFQIFTQKPIHLVIDLMGYMSSTQPLTLSMLTGAITGYGPAATSTQVSGIVTNGFGIPVSVRADVKCPDGTVQTDSVLDIPGGGTRGWSAICDGVFTLGADVSLVRL